MLMTLYRKHGAATISALYITLSLTWIAGSDMLVGGLTSNVDLLSTLQTFKGFAFVGVTGLGLYYLVNLHQKHLMDARETADKWVENSFRQSRRPMCLVDPVSLRIADANPRAEEYLGIGLDALKTMELASLFKSDTINRTSKTTIRETIVQALRSDAEQPELFLSNGGAVDISCKVEVANIVLGEQAYIRLSLIDTTRSRIFESVLRNLSEGLASETRADFHQSLAQSLSSVLGVDCVFVGELEAKNKEEQIVTTAFVQNGRIIDNKAFNKQGTPCERVVSSGKPLVVTDAPQSYPDAPKIVDLDLVSYAGVPLCDHDGNRIGLLAVMDTQPFREPILITEVLTLAAGRAAAELARMQAEKALLKSESRFRDFARIGSDWLWEQDENFRFTYLSVGGPDVTGVSTKSLLGSTRWDRAGGDPDNDPVWRDHIETVKARKPFREFRYPVKLPNGEIRHFSTNGDPVFDCDGRFTGYRGSARDITEKLTLLNNAQAAEERLMAAINSLRIGFAMFDKDERLILTNNKFKSRSSVGNDHWGPGTSIEKIVKSGIAKGGYASDMGSDEEWLQRRLSFHRNAPSLHQQHLADGRWVEIGTYPMEDGGRVLLWADITERREMETALRHSEERFRTLIDEANQGIIVHKDLRPEYCNPAFAAMFGYDSVDEILALNSIEPLLDKADLKRLRGYNDGRIAGKETPGAYEFTGIMKDGRHIPIRSQAIRVPWNDDYAICANMFDMSEQREAETTREMAEKALRRSQRMEAVGLLTGGIAHDFNNLLGIIMGNLEFVQRMIGDNEAASKRVANALMATTRGSQLTRRLLNFSSQEPKPGRPTNADEVIAGLEDMLAKSLTSEIELEFHPTDDLWLTEIDPGDLGDAVLNLVLNARDAMPNGGRLVIETGNRFLNGNEADREIRGTEMDSGDYVVVTVSDNGIGMTADLVDKVQEPLFTTKPEGRGTGLGLSMVYAFAKRSRGQVRIYSEPGHGTSVLLFLPRAQASEPITALETKAIDGPVPGGSETVLVVEDEPELREIATSTLNALGYTTMTASNGCEAWKILNSARASEIDLVFSDVIMPGGIGGFDLAERTRDLHPKMKVLLTSGFTGKLADKQADPELIRTMISKPYDHAVLGWAVRDVLDGNIATFMDREAG
ncbi:MAG: PAS domain S-box protein [Alphaproteobacteria bacterium]